MAPKEFFQCDICGERFRPIPEERLLTAIFKKTYCQKCAKAKGER